MKLCFIISSILSTMFSFSSHPIMLMVIILLQALTLCLILWNFYSISWFSYILFLIFLGGIMILFVYISALASNEKFKFFSKITNLQMYLISGLFFLAFIITNMIFKKKIKMNISILIFKLYSHTYAEITLMTMIYLIIALIVIVKIMSNFKGPLRTKN